jgi:nitrate reductase gamma subunit
MLFHIYAYLALLVFLSAVLIRIVRIARLPVHLRWELYPVPHEKGRAHYGGSILEEVDWWTKPRRVDRIGELAAMITEILLLKGVWEHNRKLWFGSFPLHFGLYLLIGALGLLAVNALLVVLGALNPPVIQILSAAAKTLAWAGYVFGCIGAAVMLYWRLGDRKLKLYNNAGHFFNLFLLGMISLTGLIWMATDSIYTIKISDFLARLMSPGEGMRLGAMGVWHLGLVLFFFLYFPFTHMTHAFVKYFTYHDIRWEDTPNLPGGKLQAKIEKLENQPVTWAAAHIGADGRKNWGDLAAESGEVKKS